MCRIKNAKFETDDIIQFTVVSFEVIWFDIEK